MALNDEGSIGSGARAPVPAFAVDRWTKRVFDIVVAILGLVLLAPIILVVSIAVKLGSRGPIFSRQTLYGYENRPIRVIKFRSSTICSKANPIHSRLTWVGRILRQTGIDEVPQLFNVLRGEMSIVGPRPYASRPDLFEYQFIPLLSGVKPGITGWAQIAGSHEEAWTTEQRINSDLRYVENWSLLLDIKIILITLFSEKPYCTAR